MPKLSASTNPIFDWQGHRGARGLYPENTIPAFLHALTYSKVTTLELDVVISADDVVIVSHEPWLSATICQGPAGEKLSGRQLSIRNMTVAEIASYDCGQLPHPRFPEQQNQPAHKPTLLAVFAAIREYCQANNRPLPHFNIELKFVADQEPIFVPSREKFVALVLTDVHSFGHPELITLQCFDPPTLTLIHELAPGLQLAYLDDYPGAIKFKMDRLGFTPAIYSPYEAHVDQDLVVEAHTLGMRVVPWTVNDTARMQELIDAGVDGLITDYPNRIPN